MKKAIIKGICAVILSAMLGSATPAEAFKIWPRPARPTATIEADARSVDELKNAIEKGDAYAAVLLGDRYFSGLGVERDLEQGFAAYRKAIELGWGIEPTSEESEAQAKARIDALVVAAERGDAEAAFALAQAYYYGGDVEENKETALEFYRKAAKLGHVNSVRAVCLWEEKWGTAKTLEFLCDVALAGNADAACNLAARYAQGDGVEQSAEKCREWYLKGIELGSADAARWLGNRYLSGNSGFETNVAQGLEYYRKAVEMGDSTAAYRLGELYFYSDGAASVLGLPVGWKSGLAKDEAKAVEFYRKAAEQDGARESDVAAYRLGLCYLNGTGVEKDEAKARGWLRKAELGDARLTLAERFGADEPFCAFIEAARWLEPEKKVENNRKFFEAVQRAAENGNASAEEWLAYQYLYGNVGYDVAKDPAKGAELGSRFAEATKDAQWAINVARFYLNDGGDAARGIGLLTKAVEWGSSDAACLLATLYGQGTVVKQDGAKCLEWYAKAVEMGNADAAHWTGNRYFSGDSGVEANFEKGVEWYAKAVEMGDPTAATRLALLYLDGRMGDFTVEPNPTKAVEWSQKALERRVGTPTLLEKGAIFETFKLVDAALLLSRATEAAGDWTLSVEWTRRAADVATVEGVSSGSLSDAARRLGARYLDGNGVERNEAEGLKWFAFADTDVAWLELAERYETGRGVEKSVEKAAEAREKAKNATRTVKIAK
ncbi:MAG: sel1 repeat family protein [Thermoguttaceae bacterium]|nr:sel1 repeat family protein [Thermoguttaceae bacterium]